MKILHIATGLIGVGAVKGAYELHRSLLNIGIDSRILMLGKEGEPGVLQCYWYEREKKKEVQIIKAHPLRKNGFISTGTQASMPDSFLQNLAWADIIHIHFIGLGFANLGEILQIPKPKLITLRDMWFFTGVCNYSDACLKYLQKCGSCHMLGSSQITDWSTYAFKNKKKLLSEPQRDLFFSAISSWVQQTAKASNILKRQEIVLINNGVDTNIFRPQEKAIGNILFIAANIENSRKGFDLFVKSIKHLKRNDISITVVGRNSTLAIKELPAQLSVEAIEYLDDDQQLSILYSKAHLLAFASREEVFGKTITEAMACGTATVAFNIGGPSEIILHGKTGFLVDPYDTAAFAQGIEWVLDHNPQTLSEQCRARALEIFSQTRIAKNYVQQYLTMI